MTDNLLVIEDEDVLGDELARHFRSEGWEVLRTANLADARTAILDRRFDPLVVLSDMNLPDGNALDLLEEVRKSVQGGEWLFLTGFGTVPDSVRALRLGAYDFVEKPCATERLDLLVSSAARGARAQLRLREQAAAQNLRYPLESFVGQSPAALKLREMLSRLSSVPITALVIDGETGTGKGLAARILHHGGPRAAGPLVEVNCAALPQELQESELFGHEAGSFTGAKGRHRGVMEQANGGTLFLDEIGEMELGLQAKLLKAIEDRRIRRVGGEKEIEVDVQVFAASNRNLADAVAENAFRGDLYHRLSVFRLDLPPLRDRIGDLEELISLFVAEFNVKAGKDVRVIPDVAWETFRSYAWPGNVRELRNVIERCVLLSTSDTLPVEWLQMPGHPQPSAGTTPPEPAKDDGSTLHLPLDGRMALDDMERFIIESALERTDGNVSAAARMLGTTRQTLRYRIQKYQQNGSPEGEEA